MPWSGTSQPSASWRYRGRRAQLEFALEKPPQTLTPGDLTKISGHIQEILASGSPQARKALFEALVHEITVQADDSVTPVFKLPIAGNDEGLALDGPAPDANQTVRTLPTMVGDTGIEPVTSSV